MIQLQSTIVSLRGWRLVGKEVPVSISLFNVRQTDRQKSKEVMRGGVIHRAYGSYVCTVQYHFD